MRALAVSLLALVAASPIFADDVFTGSRVAAVTVYPRGAEMTHRISVDLPVGDHTVFVPISGIDDLTALPRIRTSAGVSIGALGFQRAMSVDRTALFTDAQAGAFARIESLDDEISALNDQISSALAEVQALDARLAFLSAAKPGDTMDAAALLALADMIQSETAAAQAAKVAAGAALRPMKEALGDLQADRKAAQRAFDRLSPPSDVSDVLAINLTVAQAGQTTLELTELTAQAGWQLDYDLDLDRAANSLSVARKLIVEQNTGQSWTGVDLTLSTARPGEEVGPSPVGPDQARIHEEIALLRGGASDMAAPAPEMEAAVVMEAPEMKTAGLQIDGLSLSYVYPDAVTIASAEAAELALDTLTLAADAAIEAAPRFDDTAFVVATLTNTAGEPILPGSANILRDGHLVGRTYIEMIPAGAETKLPFGPIEGIRLNTVFARNAEGDTGILTRSNTREQQISFSVENLTDEVQDVRAIYPLTYSEQEDLRVRVSAMPQPDETDIDDMRGVSAWDLTLAPGETKTVSITVQLDWPEGQNLTWYP